MKLLGKQRVILCGIALCFFISPQLHAQFPTTAAPVWTFEIQPPSTKNAPYELIARVQLPAGYYQDADSPFLKMEVDAPYLTGPLKTSEPQLRAGKSSFTGSFTLSRTLLEPIPSLQEISVRYGWQICRIEGICLLPVEKTSRVEFVKTSSTSNAESSVWVYLILAFVGGILMNVMPCVFPLLSIRALTLLKSANELRISIRRSQIAFAVGIVTSVVALGLTLALFRWVGMTLTWGFYFQNSFFVVTILLLFWILALQLWGLFQWTLLLHVTRGSGFLSNFFAGVVEVLAAAPCTAPFLGTTMGFALTQDPGTIVAIFVSIGLGLALPPIIFAIVPRWVEKLPKPGLWLENFERLMGFFLAASALYMLWILQRQKGVDFLFAALGLLLFVSVLFWIVGKWTSNPRTKTPKWAIWLGAWILLAAAFFVLLSSEENQPAGAAIKSPWIAFTQETLDRALEERKLVFVDVTAAWCATCQVNEATTLDRKEILDLMQSKRIVLLRADMTNPAPEIEAWLSKNHRVGIPVYALYRPDLPVQFFPELLTSENFTDVMSQLP